LSRFFPGKKRSIYNYYKWFFLFKNYSKQKHSLWGWRFGVRKPVEWWVFRTRPDQPFSTSSCLHNGFWILPGGRVAGELQWPPTAITSQNPILLTHQAPKSKSNCSKSTRNSNINFSTPSKIYHQNIRGLRCKTNELISHLHPTPPHNGGWTQAVPDGHNINKTACYQITSCTVCLSNVIPTLIYAPWGWSHRGIETCRRYFKSILIR